jgi:hypothetical protein
MSSGSGFLRKLAEQLDLSSQSKADLDIEGARPQYGVYEKKLVDLQNILSNPGFSVKDIVCFACFS